MEAAEFAALEWVIAALIKWANQQGVNIRTEPADMTMIEALYYIRETGVQLEAREAKLLVAGLASLQQLCALRTRARGLQRARAELEHQVSQIPESDRHRRALEVLQDDSHRRKLDASFDEARRRVVAVRRALVAFEEGVPERMAKLKRVGYGAIAIPEAARDLATSRWLRHRGDQYLDDLDLFQSETTGVVASQTAGHPGETDSYAWRLVRGRCMLAIRDAGGSLGLLVELFENWDVTSSPEQKKDRVRKRLEEAKKANTARP